MKEVKTYNQGVMPRDLGEKDKLEIRVISTYSSEKVLTKGKPLEREGRKATRPKGEQRKSKSSVRMRRKTTGLTKTAGLPWLPNGGRAAEHLYFEKKPLGGTLMKKAGVLTMAVIVIVMGLSLASWAAVDRGNGSPTASATLAPTVSWSALNWVILYIPDGDMSVTLGTIDENAYDPTTTTWTPISDGLTHSAWVITNDRDGFTLTVSAVDTGATVITDMSDFQMKGGDFGTTWTGMASSGNLVDKGTNTAGYFIQTTDIEYQYVPDEDDPVGSYQVTVTYTVTTK